MPNGRCRYHGGKSTGAMNPAVAHGLYTKASIQEQEQLNQLLRETRELLSKDK
jgi:hypothetical protein